MSTDIKNQGEGEAPKAPAGEEGNEAENPQLGEIEELKKLVEDANATVATLKRENKKLGKEIDALKHPTETPEKTTQQSNEPDYAKLAFLEGKSVKHPDDQQLVLDEAKRLNLPLTDVLGMEYIQEKLKAAGNERDVKAATPKGSGRTGGTSKGEVEYYLEHHDEVPPNQDLHAQVIKAKMAQHESANKFSSVPFVG